MSQIRDGLETLIFSPEIFRLFFINLFRPNFKICCFNFAARRSSVVTLTFTVLLKFFRLFWNMSDRMWRYESWLTHWSIPSWFVKNLELNLFVLPSETGSSFMPSKISTFSRISIFSRFSWTLLDSDTTKSKKNIYILSVKFSSSQNKNVKQWLIWGL